GPLLGLQRATAINQRTPGFRQLSRPYRKPTLQCRERSDVGRTLEPGDVRMTADSSRRRARCVEENGVERPRLPLRGVSGDDFCAEAEPGEILPQSLQPLRRSVDGGDVRAGSRELGGFATRRRAQIRNCKPAHVAKELCRQGGRGVLHPPGTLGIAWQLRY